MDKKVWARHPELVWVQATIQSESGNNLNVIGSDGKGFSVAKSDTVHCSTTHSNPSLDNLIELDELIEPSILSQLRLRYTKDDIYTWIGSILVSINPYKSLPIYTIGVLQEFLSGTRKSQAHIYSLANMAYKAMSGGDSVGGNLNQAVIISGNHQ